MVIEVKGKYLRIRVKDPKLFVNNSFRTDDIGRKGHSMRITAINKQTGKWETQSWRLLVADIKKDDLNTMILLNKIADQNNMQYALQTVYRKIKKGV
jgi:hypothetical protein